MTKNEEAALQAAKYYRAQLNKLEDDTALRLASQWRNCQRRIMRSMKTLSDPDDRKIPMNVRYDRYVAPAVTRHLVRYVRDADALFVQQTKAAAQLGVKATIDECQKVTEKKEDWQKVSTAGLFTGGIFKAGRDALANIPSAISGKLGELVNAASGMAEQGMDWLMSQVGDFLGNAWRGIQRVVRTAAEQLFRRAQQEQRQQTPVRQWRRCANHETACLACLLLEGHIYDREEDFADHPNGRCYIVPCEPGSSPDHAGRDWLESQDEETQRKIMGKTRYEAWQNGDISLDEMTELRQTEEYGLQPYIRTLKELGLAKSK